MPLTSVFAIFGEELINLVTDFAVRDLNIVLGGTVVGHEGEEAVVSHIELEDAISGAESGKKANTYELVLLAANVGHVHVVGRWTEIFQLLRGEDVDGDQVDLGVTVLARLGGGHFDNLARTVLDDNEAVLPQSRALHGVRGRGTGIGALECVLMLHEKQSVLVLAE